MELSSLVTEYDKRLIGVLDKHAPLKEKKVKQSHSQPWFNEKSERRFSLDIQKRDSIRQPKRIHTQRILPTMTICSKSNKKCTVRLLQPENTRDRMTSKPSTVYVTRLSSEKSQVHYHHPRKGQNLLRNSLSFSLKKSQR